MKNFIFMTLRHHVHDTEVPWTTNTVYVLEEWSNRKNLQHKKNIVKHPGTNKNIFMMNLQT